MLQEAGARTRTCVFHDGVPHGQTRGLHGVRAHKKKGGGSVGKRQQDHHSHLRRQFRFAEAPAALMSAPSHMSGMTAPPTAPATTSTRKCSPSNMRDHMVTATSAQGTAINAAVAMLFCVAWYVIGSAHATMDMVCPEGKL